MAAEEPPRGTKCKECGNKLDAFERSNYHYGLQKMCVNCRVSPKITAREQAVNDMGMSPFTSVKRINDHLVHAHGLSDQQVVNGVSSMTGARPENVHDQNAQYHWRALHEMVHEMGGPEHNLHDPASTEIGDEFEHLFNDRRG